MSVSLLIGDAAALLGKSEEQTRRIIDRAGLGAERDSSGRRLIATTDFLALVASRAARKAK